MDLRVKIIMDHKNYNAVLRLGEEPKSTAHGFHI